MLAGFATFIALQCDLLCDSLRKIPKEKYVLNKYVEHHWKILSFAKDTETLFSQIYFGQFINSTLAYCMTLFLLTLVDRTSFEFFYLVFYQTSMFCLLLVPCWFSSEITTKSKNIPIAAYECFWTDKPNYFKKDLLFFIHMSQEPIKLYAIGFFHISVEIFVKILRLSLSYFAVLNNLMGNESENK
ncbi:odorant receptor 4-like [Anoplophora glabripennis]|uniref:odorant receptor 4-like n=1 Tax=Anoplophora glabripennis TaxID=217634 RepID=UPI0008754FFD|nr:odorant receptor 4-like [Anoplophora glabripennis]